MMMVMMMMMLMMMMLMVMIMIMPMTMTMTMTMMMLLMMIMTMTMLMLLWRWWWRWRWRCWCCFEDEDDDDHDHDHDDDDDDDDDDDARCLYYPLCRGCRSTHYFAHRFALKSIRLGGNYLSFQGMSLPISQLCIGCQKHFVSGELFSPARHFQVRSRWQAKKRKRTLRLGDRLSRCLVRDWCSQRWDDRPGWCVQTWFVSEAIFLVAVGCRG